MGDKRGEVALKKFNRRGKVKWAKRYAVLKSKRRELILGDKKYTDDVTPDDKTHAVRCITLGTDIVCIPLESERRNYKKRYLFGIMSEGEDQIGPEVEVTLSVKTPEERDSWVKEINDVINEQKAAPSDETITLEDLDAIKVETDALNHLNKTRPKFQGRRRPQKRPRKMLEDIDENAEKKQKTENEIESPIKSTDRASSSGLGLDSEVEGTSKGPSSSCSHDNLNENENAQGRRYKRKGKKCGANHSPTHAEVRRRQKGDRNTSLLKRLSNRLSQVFGHSSSTETEKGDGFGTSPGSTDRQKSDGSLDVSIDLEGGSDVDGTLTSITSQAEKLLTLTRSLQEDLLIGNKNDELVQKNLKYIRLAMKHLEKSLENMSLVERGNTGVEE